MEEIFRPSEAISYGWKTVREHFAFFLVAIGLYAAIIVVELIPRAALNLLSKESDDLSVDLIIGVMKVVIQIVSLYLTTALTIGVIKTCLKIYDGGEYTYGEIFKSFGDIKKIFFILVADFIVAAIVIIGLILLIVPGIYFALMFSQSRYFIIDRNRGPLKAMGASMSATGTSGVKMTLFVYYLLIFLVNLLGLIACGIGILITIPLSLMASIYVFRKLAPKNPAGDLPPIIDTSSGPVNPGFTG